MKSKFELMPHGSVTSTPGFRAGVVYAGIRKTDQPDLALLTAERPGAAAGIFTRNRFQAPPITVSKEHLKSGDIQAVIVNAGCANAGTGAEGRANAEAATEAAAARLGISAENVLVASTGVIGVQLPIGKVREGLKRLELSPDAGHDFARAIMTTDTVAKEVAVRSAEYGFTLAGCAKGAGMIHPDMATMLGFITTDIKTDPATLQKALRRSADKSFNVISVDGDTSTNDCVLLLSSASSGVAVTPGSAAYRAFAEALDYVCIHLAKAVARDGEGATRLIELAVTGARTIVDARRVARTVLSSPLVKTAIHGADPNWGRIVAAAGRSGARFELERTSLKIGEVEVLKNGTPQPFDKKVAAAQFHGAEVFIKLDLGLGKGTVTGWGCDMSAEYISINADYTT